MKRKWVILTVVGVGLTAVLFLPAVKVARWGGRYLLTVHITEDSPVDLESIRFETFSHPGDAQSCIDHPEVMAGSKSPQAEGRRFTISVQTSGATGPGTDLYTQPKLLLVQYRPLNAEPAAPPGFKWIDLPQVRGDREITVQLP